MEFLTPNYFNTSTMIAVNNNTATAANLFSRNPLYQYYSDGMDDDNTTTSFIITFDSTMPVSRIVMQDINFKEFRLFYNGATANAFTFTNADTTTSAYTGNADENKYFRFATLQVSSITVECKKTIVANSEKVFGLLSIADLELALTKIPNAKGFKPKRTPKQVIHTLSDGGTRIHSVGKKWSHQLKLTHITEAQRAALDTLYGQLDEFIYCPFGTATGWGGICYEGVWDGPNTFNEYSDDAVSAGFSGTISIKETPY